MLGLSFSLLNHKRIKYLSKPFKVPQTVNQRPMSSFKFIKIYNGSINNFIASNMSIIYFLFSLGYHSTFRLLNLENQ